MPASFLTAALLAVSLLTNLTVEGVKKLLDETSVRYSSNVLAAALSVFIAGAVCAAYLILNGIAFSAKIGVEAAALMYMGFLVSTVGYDKVIQTIGQVQIYKEDSR